MVARRQKWNLSPCASGGTASSRVTNESLVAHSTDAVSRPGLIQVPASYDWVEAFAGRVTEAVRDRNGTKVEELSGSLQGKYRASR